MRIAAHPRHHAVCRHATGCKSRMASCSQDDKDYSGARELPPLQAPPGLDAPNTRNALKVPPLNTPERERGKNEPCLDFRRPLPAQPVRLPRPQNRKTPSNKLL